MPDGWLIENDIRDDRTVEGYLIETRYCTIKSFERKDDEQFLRVVADDDFQDIEIRLSVEYLERMLVTIKAQYPENITITP